MRSGNPALHADTFSRAPAMPGAERMTLGGTVNKTALSLFILLIAASYIWNRGPADPALPVWMIGGVIGGLIVAIATAFKKTWAPVTTPMYAAFEGVALGGISVIMESQYPGIVSQAVFLTFGTLAALLVAYRSGLIKATENFKLGIFAATGGIALVYLASFVLGFFGMSVPLIHSSGHVGNSVQPVRGRDRRAEPRAGFRLHRDRSAAGRAEVHGMVRRVRTAGDARVAVSGNPAPAREAAEPERLTRPETPYAPTAGR